MWPDFGNPVSYIVKKGFIGFYFCGVGSRNRKNSYNGYKSCEPFKTCVINDDLDISGYNLRVFYLHIFIVCVCFCVGDFA